MQYIIINDTCMRSSVSFLEKGCTSSEYYSSKKNKSLVQCLTRDWCQHQKTFNHKIFLFYELERPKKEKRKKKSNPKKRWNHERIQKATMDHYIPVPPPTFFLLLFYWVSTTASRNSAVWKQNETLKLVFRPPAHFSIGVWSVFLSFFLIFFLGGFFGVNKFGSYHGSDSRSIQYADSESCPPPP